MAELCRLKKHPMVSLMLFCKNLLSSTIGSQIINLLIYLNFCLETLSHNLRSKDLFDQILLKSEPSSPPKKKYSVTLEGCQ